MSENVPHLDTETLGYRNGKCAVARRYADGDILLDDRQGMTGSGIVLEYHQARTLYRISKTLASDNGADEIELGEDKLGQVAIVRKEDDDTYRFTNGEGEHDHDTVFNANQFKLFLIALRQWNYVSDTGAVKVEN